MSVLSQDVIAQKMNLSDEETEIFMLLVEANKISGIEGTYRVDELFDVYEKSNPRAIEAFNKFLDKSIEVLKTIVPDDESDQ